MSNVAHVCAGARGDGLRWWVCIVSHVCAGAWGAGAQCTVCHWSSGSCPADMVRAGDVALEEPGSAELPTMPSACVALVNPPDLAHACVGKTCCCAIGVDVGVEVDEDGVLALVEVVATL